MEKDIKKMLMDDLKASMKSKDLVKTSVIKNIRAAVANYEKENSEELTNTVFVTLLDKLIKDREKSIKMFKDGGRNELVETEEYEVSIIEAYLPKRLSVEEIREEALKVQEETGATGMKDMGRMMGILKNKLGGTAKPADVSKVVKEILQ